MSYPKNYKSLINVWKIVTDKHSDWLLEIWGAGEEYKTLNQRIISLGLQNNIFLKGYTNDVSLKLAESSLFILSSIFEGFGLVIIEAMSCGVPVVSYACPCGPQDIIADGHDGFLVPVNDEKVLADRICRLIEDKELRKEMGKAARLKAEQYDIKISSLCGWNYLISLSTKKENEKDIETDLISVIVPIFNVEAYLRPCIESILASTYTTLQIILVNDGSTDHSGEICDEYTRKDTRIEVIHQKNAGLSPARNSGMKAAKGKYISFIDGDDYIHPQMYEVLLEALQEGNYSFSMILGIYDNDKSYSIPSAYTKSILTQEIMIKSLFNHIHPQQGIKEVQAQVVWNKLYKRELLDNEFSKRPVQKILSSTAGSIKNLVKLS